MKALNPIYRPVKRSEEKPCTSHCHWLSEENFQIQEQEGFLESVIENGSK
jgi:hypothetical protein